MKVLDINDAQNLTAAIIDIIEDISGHRFAELRGADRIREDLGFDSMMSMRLLAEIAERLQVPIDIEGFMEAETVKDIELKILDIIANNSKLVNRG